MPKLIAAPNIERPDDFYAALQRLYESKKREECEAISARLILLLANHIGDIEALQDALDMAVPETPLDRPAVRPEWE